MSSYIQIFITVPNKSEAGKIARLLVHKKLVGCTQVVGPIESVFRWKGKIETAKEWLCIIKTTGKNYKKVEREIKKMHPYTVPEIIAMPLVAGNPDYFLWLVKETK